jgi:hypothetical protein
MATRSSVRLSRLSDRAIVVQRQLISFQLRQTGFFLPLDWVYRAMVFEANAIRQNQVSFDEYRLPLVNVGKMIFGEDTPPHPPGTLIGLVLQRPGTAPQLILPIDSAPALCRIPDASFVPLPQTYAVHCITEMTDNNSSYPLHFLLSPQQLLTQVPQIQPLASASARSSR